jgi:hypothetical protein
VLNVSNLVRWGIGHRREISAHFDRTGHEIPKNQSIFQLDLELVSSGTAEKLFEHRDHPPHARPKAQWFLSSNVYLGDDDQNTHPARCQLGCRGHCREN